MKSPLLAFIVLVLAYAVSSCTQGSTPEESSSAPATVAPPVINEDVDGVISQLERDWVADIVKKDVDALDRLLAEEFNGTSPTAHTFNKAFAILELRALVVERRVYVSALEQLGER